MLPTKRRHEESCGGGVSGPQPCQQPTDDATPKRAEQPALPGAMEATTPGEAAEPTQQPGQDAPQEPPKESPEEADADGEPSDDEMARESLSLEVVWKGTERYPLKVPKYATVLSIKALLEELTEVESEGQKLLGLVKGRLPRDADTLADLGVQDGTRVRLVGTRTDDRLRTRESSWQDHDSDAPAIPDNPAADAGKAESGEEHQVVSVDVRDKLDTIIRSAEVRIMNPPRPGRKLVVLDLDYTLFDCKNMSGNIVEMARPGLHEFLAAVYPYYDLIVWSQTKWHVVECKITLLGMVAHPNYKITTALDISTMFTVRSIRSGRPVDHQVKALEFIWAWFPGIYTHSNTIHIDDLGRNFALNRQNGLKIRPYKRADSRGRADTELYRLTRYMLAIARLPTLEFLDHSQWCTHR